MGLFWDDDDAFAWQGDYETVWTYQSDFEPLPVITVTPPAGLQTETWYAKGHYRVPAGTNQVNPFCGTVTIGFDGNDVYVQGVFTAVFGQWQAMLDNTSPLNQAWIKGTIDGDQVTFSGLQQIGTMEGTTHYAVGSDGADLTDFTMTWDAEAKVLKSQNKLIDNTQTVDVSAFIWMDDLTIQIEGPNKPIETLPYANGFDTTDEWERFTVTDANYDGSSWQHYEGEASYKYNSDNQADDWLISPAIRHTSTDVFGVMLDDVTFNYAGAVTSYNIYCDGQLVATVEDGVTTYTVPADQLTDGDHTFAVTAVYANGQESQPASATLTVTGIEGLLITGHGQLPADIYTTDGRLVRRQATTLNGLKGIYIINGKKTVIN